MKAHADWTDREVAELIHVVVWMQMAAEKKSLTGSLRPYLPEWGAALRGLAEALKRGAAKRRQARAALQRLVREIGRTTKTDSLPRVALGVH